MTIHKLIIVFILSFAINNYGQTIDQNLITFPVSPEASRLGSYGAVPVNLNSGLLEQNIELFNEKVSDYSFPLNLIYNYSGFKVEESPSIVGLGWQLNVGGVVTREVRGIPDEHAKGYYGHPFLRETVLGGYFANGTMQAHYAKNIAQGLMDSEADLYVLSVNGIRFSFKIGLDGTPCFLSKHDYRLTINRMPNNPLKIISFMLTDTNANTYIFDQIETNVNVVGNMTLFDDGFPNYNSSWQLSKIILNNNANIVYTYYDDTFYSYNFFATGVKRFSNHPEIPASSYNQGSTKDQIERKLLKSITSDNFSIHFTISTANNQKVYSAITVKDFTDNIVKNFDFTYSGSRNCLTKINKNNIFFYEFDYYEVSQGFVSSTMQMPWNTDDWGYANGLGNQYGVSIPGTLYQVNKLPSLIFTKAGALYKIKYPTGGYTQIYYEQNSIGGDINGDYSTPNRKINLKFKSDNTTNAPHIKEKYYRKTFTTDVVATLSTTVYSEIQAFIELKINKVPLSGAVPTEYSLPEQYYIKIPVQRNNVSSTTPSVIPKLYDILNDGYTTDSATLNRTSDGKFIIPAGTYEFRFIATYNNYATKKSNVTVTLDYYDANLAQLTNMPANQEVGGIRVKETIDYPVIGNQISTKYSYNNKEGLSLGRLNGALTRTASFTEVYGYPIFNGFGSASTSAVEYTSKPFSIMTKHGSPVSYSGVKKFSEEITIEQNIPLQICNCTGDFGSNYDGSSRETTIPSNLKIKKVKYPRGFESKNYAGSNRYPSNDYPFPPQGNDISAGVEIRSSVYGPSNSSYVEDLLYDEEKTYTFSNNTTWNQIYNNPNYPKSLKMGFKFKRFGTGPALNPLPLNQEYKIAVYAEVDSESLLSQTKSKEFFNGQSIEKNNLYFYNTHDQLKKTTTSNTNGEVLSKEIYYPYDFSDAVSLDMVSKNFIAPVVEIVTKNNDAIINTTKYKYFALPFNLFKPDTYFSSKGGNSLETRTKYEYDSKGNLVQFKNTSFESPIIQYATSEAYTQVIWGYGKSLPIAKIEMPSYITLSSALINSLQDASNSDIDESSEIVFRDALNNLRISYPKAMITTYTYNPLIGITSITDPKGDMITYHYDTLGRLIFVKDKEGNVIKSNNYHYSTQN